MSPRRAELLIAVVPVLLAVATLAILLDAGLGVATLNLPLDVAIAAAAALVAVTVSGLGWVQYREAGDGAALLRASAFMVLAAWNAMVLAIMVTGTQRAFGFDLEHPGQFPALATLLGHLEASVILALAGLVATHAWQTRRWPPLLVFWGPSLAFAAASVSMAAVQGSLPTVLGPGELSALQHSPTAPLVLADAQGLVAAEVTVGLVYLAAALLAYRNWRRDLRPFDAFLSVGLVVAAFSQVQFALHPGTYGSLVTLGDLLRLIFYATLLAALVAERRTEIRALRVANNQLVILREGELARAAADERARLAREIHDGMSQELWFAKLRQSRLAAMDLPSGARDLAQEVAFALDSALSEARQAILALRPGGEATFTELLDRYVSDFSDRFGIPVEFRCDSAVDDLGPRRQAELLRIAQEALTNVQRHADATFVRVEVAGVDGILHLAVTDNGRGFDPASTGVGQYGLGSMRERAELIGGTLEVESGAGAGTRLVVRLPLAVGR